MTLYDKATATLAIAKAVGSKTPACVVDAKSADDRAVAGLTDAKAPTTNYRRQGSR
jgi:hypothetical protein